ncbi:FAD-binding oxidoreductase [Streptomyces sp. ISL-22]|uniref:FAD-binding oxidoreductase n=1 Tax=unclassified Streptomyces TaxID=2593676 RepID=UPI001BE8016F|nr:MULTISPECIES: FAD-binding oxidoreductase [unclassified Streptomyces]MBT2419072.1 FAD-binding oxidoreductase [Streptomyces sp. ISL-24]MBT2431167.1 FAD-binding oxidoreductase [Streptomyces sp. ISL-22]
MTASHHLNTPDLFALSEIHGPVLRPGEDGYADEVTGFNLAALHTPDVVVGATGVDDIVTALRWASATGTPVAVQSTGHGANFPIDHGLLISTTRMTDVRISPQERLATIAAGARWRHVLDAAAPHGLAALAGTSTDAGAVGYTLGGGLPVLGRAYGYAADLVRSFQVVTPDGTLRETDAEHEPELFWALRGGKGNVGVVTSMVCELLPLSTILGGGVYCPGEHTEALLRAWADWTRTVPDEMCSAFTLLRLPPIPEIPEPLRGGFWARVAIAWPGDPAEGERLLAPIRSAAPVAVDTVEEMPYAALDRIHMEPQDPLPGRESCALMRDLPPDAVRAFLDEVGPEVPDCPLLLVEIRHLGGALSRPARLEDAICARDANYFLETVGVLAAPPAAEAIERATASLHRAMAPYGTGRTMVNVHGTPGDESDRARAWTPEVYDRLRHDKSTYDPANLLRFGHTVPLGA